MSKKEPQVTFAALGVHPSICSALDNHGISHPRELQRRTLSHTVHDFADVIAEAPPHSGRHTLLSVLAAHCVLSAEAKNAVTILIANSTATSSKLLSVFHQLLSSTRVVALPCLDDRPPKASSAPSGGGAGTVYVGTFGTFTRWSPEYFASTVTLVIEDCHMHDVKQLQTLIDQIIQAAPSTNLFFLSAVPPSEVNLSIRYLLRRKHRRYFFQGTPQPHFSYLMCHDADDRAALSLKLAQLSGCKNVLMLTHNREVRDLKAQVQALGLKTFSIQRNTVPAEHDRILSDFLRSPYAVLVAMDAYTGVDLMDLDAVIQFYPPQKSMPEDEWAEHVSYLQTTSDPRRRTLIATLVAPDDFSLVSYFMRRVGAEGPLLNVSPTHPQFEHVVFHPEHALQQKLKLTSNAAVTPHSTASGNAGGGGGGSGPLTIAAAAAAAQGKSSAASSLLPFEATEKHFPVANACSTVVPLPRSQRQADEQLGGSSSQDHGGKRKADKQPQQQQQQSRGSSDKPNVAAPAATQQLLAQLLQGSQRPQSGSNNNNSNSSKPASAAGGNGAQNQGSRGNGGAGGKQSQQQPSAAAAQAAVAPSSSSSGAAAKGAPSQSPQSQQQQQQQGNSKGKQQQQQGGGGGKQQQQQSGGGVGKASAAGAAAVSSPVAPTATSAAGPTDEGQPEGSAGNDDRRRRHRRH